MAFCGVDTGSMKPNEAANVAASAGTIGSTPAAVAIGMMIGTTTAAAAVLLVVSDTTMASTTAKAVMANWLPRPSASDDDSPMVLASPVSSSSAPKMMPVPNSMMVPQSILAASLQLSVYSRFFQSTGSRNSSDAPITATMPSLSRPDTVSYTDSSRSPTKGSGRPVSTMSATTPGKIHKVTVRPKANNVFFSALDSPPIAARSART